MHIKYMALGLLVLAGGCGGGPYEKAIAEFSGAVAASDAAIDRFAEQLQARERERRIAAAVDQPHRLMDIGLTDADIGAPLDDLVGRSTGCTSTSVRCLLVLRKYRGDEPAVLEPGPQLARTRQLIEELAIYAANLKALAASEAAASAKGSIDAINGQIGDIAKLLGHATPEPVSAAGDLVSWVVGAYLDSVKLAALRDATANGEKALGEPTAFLAAVARLSDAAAKGEETASYADARAAVLGAPGGATRADILAWEAARKRLDLLLRLDSGGVFRDMRAAHAALYRALHSPDLSFEGALAEIKRFRESAEELIEILKRLEPGPAKEG